MKCCIVPVLIAVFAAGCASEQAEPAVATVSPQWAPSAPAPDDRLELPATDDQVTDDLRRMCAGAFAVDHLGEPAYRPIWIRFKSAPLAYLATSVELAKSARHHELSNLYLAGVVKRAAELDPEGARKAALELLPVYRKAKEDAGRSPWDNAEGERLARQIFNLEQVAGQRDPAPYAPTVRATPIAQR